MRPSFQESKPVEQEGEQAPSDTQEPSETHREDFQTSDTTDPNAPTPDVQDKNPTEQPIPAANIEPVEPLTPTTPTSSTTTAPSQPPAVQKPEGHQPVNRDRQSRVYTLPDSYRGVGGEVCAGYGSLSRTSVHGYWPAKSFQPGAHYTLPFLRDSYGPAGLSSQAEEDGVSERGENPVDVKTGRPANSYPTLGGIHQFRPITTMELLREPSRTRYEGGTLDCALLIPQGRLCKQISSMFFLVSMVPRWGQTPVTLCIWPVERATGE